MFAPAASPIGIIQYIWSRCFVSLCFALYLSAAQGWDAKHLLSIFLSQQLYTAAGELQAVVPAVTLLMLKVFEARRPLVKVEILVSLSFCSDEYLKHAHGNVSPMSFPFCCKQQWKKSGSLPASRRHDAVDGQERGKCAVMSNLCFCTKTTAAKFSFCKRGLMSSLLSEGKSFFWKIQYCSSSASCRIMGRETTL